MAKKDKFQYLTDGTLDTSAWLEKMKQRHGLVETSLLNNACALTQKLTHGLTTFYGQPYIEQGLEIAEVILDLKLDQETAAAGILTNVVSLTHPKDELIRKELGDKVAKLVSGVQQMDIITSLQKKQTSNKSQIDKIRKMLLAMATDIRVVIIKLAERLCFLRGIKAIPVDERKPFAEEIFDIYAPLANRLGMGQVKWELEDLAFYYQDPITYKMIATFLAERRTDRERRIQELIAFLRDSLKAANIDAEVTGRAKHIYSIYLKAKRKHVSYKEIYDQSAVRILVPNLEDCYTALSLVHHQWPPIMAEFDDYVANPKPNGYRSIHTAVIGDDDKHFEIQIRTSSMHEEAERGVAAHWLYKEKDKQQPIDDSAKITYLRQLLDWHQEIAGNDNAINSQELQLLNDQIYVITPAGEILDLPQGATPIDFAYHIHSELGHRCRGAKVNGQIVPLTHHLRTGDRIEIITVLQGTPSRDWMNPELGYIKSSRARSKISHWFKQQELNHDIEEGRQILERELTRSGLSKTISLATIAKQFNVKDEDALLASISRGNVRPVHVVQAMQPKSQEKAAPAPITVIRAFEKSPGAAIAGSSDFLTRFARCCKPIPGDDIIGYITHGRGISIHKKSCNNIRGLSDPQRFIKTDWDEKNKGFFSTDLKIIAQEQTKALGDISALFANEKVDLLKFQSNFDKKQNKIFIIVTVQVQNIEQLNKLLHRLQQLPSILQVTRIKV